MKTTILTPVRAFLVLSSVGLAAQSPQPVPPADQPQQIFRSAVDLVTIQASVRDNKGRPMKGLTRNDFEIRDNGQVRPILSLRADLKSPVSLALLVDMSGSMDSHTKITMARQAFDSVIYQLRAGEDEVALFTFDSTTRLRQDFTRDLAKLKGALNDFEPFGTTSLFDATAETARRLAARSATHKAIIVLTDGIDTSSTMTAAQVSGLASAIDVPVFVVVTIPSLDQRVMVEASGRAVRSEAADLRDLAEWTGGQLLFASTLTETVIAASNLVDELRQQYVLAIEAAAGREWRRLDVRIRNSSAVVKARSGYYGG